MRIVQGAFGTTSGITTSATEEEKTEQGLKNLFEETMTEKFYGPVKEKGSAEIPKQDESKDQDTS